MSKRIYIAVPVLQVKVDAKPRLVNSGTPAAARLHVTRNIFEIRVATSHEVAKLVGDGVRVEEAGDEQRTATLPGMPESLDVTKDDSPLPADQTFEELEQQGAHRL